MKRWLQHWLPWMMVVGSRLTLRSYLQLVLHLMCHMLGSLL
jgi:hypothetical protein